MVAAQVVLHDLVLDDVQVAVGRDNAFSDRVVPARDMGDNGEPQAPGSDEKRDGVPRLDVADDERRALPLHRLEKSARHVPASAEVPPLHRALEEAPAWQRAFPVGVEHPVRVARLHPLEVEAVPAVEPDRERVVADPPVEPGVDAGSPRGSLGFDRELVAEEHRAVTESRAPLGRLFARDEEDRGQPAAEPLAEPVDDPGVEEHADRELVGKDEPDPLHARTPSCAAMRPASEAPSSWWKRSTSSGVPHAGQPSTP